MAQEKKRMPQTMAGLINYSDEVEEGINLKPEVVLALGFGICLILVLSRIIF
ncbi:MAG: preprotein translocase subunit Sec61beta [Candidatus Aenigmarchaeota archaeon]|nr:preprotein translocase subunit Sec61beta [Candidatus Aenigmarchaeota archaeon]